MHTVVIVNENREVAVRIPFTPLYIYIVIVEKVYRGCNWIFRGRVIILISY